MLKACVRIGLVVAFLVGGYASSEDSPKICGGQQKCNELQRLYLMDAYKSAIIAETQAEQASRAAQETLNRYREQAASLATKEGQVEGTTYQPDVQRGIVTANPPAPKPEPKQEKK